jgi:glyoxylase-like metal-dependent hydrolase (beta-lactamase superfamily II)
MLRARIAATVAAVVFLVSAALAQSVVRTADPIKRGLKETDFPRTIRITDNVYTYEDFHAGDEKFTTTNMFVVTNDGVVVADGQGTPAATKGLVDAIAKVTSQPIKYVIICSDHGDHTAGNASFPDTVTYVVHPTSKAILERATNGWKPPADRTEVLTERRMIALGGEFVGVFFPGRAHTGGDLAVWLGREKILFLSEIFLNRVFPAMRSAYPTEWLKTLDVVSRIDATVYIPGHGFTESGPVSKEELRAYRGAVEAVIAEATRLHNAGVPVDEAIKQANFGEYSAWTLARSQAPIAVRKVYDELDGKLK